MQEVAISTDVLILVNKVRGRKRKKEHLRMEAQKAGEETGSCFQDKEGNISPLKHLNPKHFLGICLVDEFEKLAPVLL